MLAQASTWNSIRMLSRADVSFRRDADGVLTATLMLWPAKKRKHRGGKCVPVVLRDGSVLTPASDLLDLMEADPVPEACAASTPLFRRMDGSAFTTAYVRGLVRLCVSAGSPGTDPRLYGSHSLRIGGASTLLAAGVPPAIIQIMGRWDSDVYAVYCRWSQQSARRAGAIVSSAQLNDLAGAFLDEEFCVRARRPAAEVAAPRRAMASGPPDRQPTPTEPGRQRIRRARGATRWGVEAGHVTPGSRAGRRQPAESKHP